MKRLFLIAALAIAFASSVSAQIQGPPPPGHDYFPEQWQTYEFKDDKCKVSLPYKPTETEGGSASNYVVRTNHIEYNGAVRYTLNSTEYSVDAEKIGADAILEGSKKGFLDGMKKIEPRIVKEQNITFEGHPGKFLQIETNNVRVLRVKLLVIKTHLYVLLVDSGTTAKFVMGSENNYEKIAMAFLDSFQLIP